ncbi:MAG: phosphoribosyl-AMP cyclohydrolase [Sarcina sp.]
MKNVNLENLNAIDFEKGYGLIPAIIQDATSNEVLMMAYMSKESLEKTLETKTTWFFSRKRNKLWNKGESSGNIQEVIDIYSDCDMDTLLIKVNQNGVACHTGKKSCFYNDVMK